MATFNLFSKFSYDYFLKDHLGNVHIVLTEDQQIQQYPAATIEVANATIEEALYSNLSSTRQAAPLGNPDYTTSGTNKVAKVGSSSGPKKIGPAILLKVMAGGTDLYARADDIKTADIEKGNVYKIPDHGKVSVNENGIIIFTSATSVLMFFGSIRARSFSKNNYDNVKSPDTNFDSLASTPRIIKRTPDLIKK